MTIDVHCHLYAEGFHNVSFVGPSAINVEAGGTSGWHGYDQDGFEHIKRMDEARIDRCNLLHIDMGDLPPKGIL